MAYQTENTQTKGTALFSQRTQDVDVFLDSFDQERFDLVTDMFAHCLTPYEVVVQLDVSYSLWMLARETNTVFNEQVLRWETLAIAKLHTMAREGINSPKKFSSSAYDRVAQVLSITYSTQDEHHVASRDVFEADNSSQQSGFDIQAFLKAHNDSDFSES